jgi:hypothetical protein
MAFPPPTIQTNITEATEQGAGLHAGLHNALAAGVNDLTGEAQRINGVVVALGTQVTTADNALDARLDAAEAELTVHQGVLDKLYGATERGGIIRGRTNIDSVLDGGAVRFTVPIYDDFTIVDTGDGSGFRSGTGVYAVAASTVADGGDDMTCYISIGNRGVAVGSRLVGDTASYVTWTGRVVAGEQISVRVRMPVPRAVIGGRLEIWRVAIADPMS